MHGSQSTIELPDLDISDNFENITSDTLEKDFQVIPDHEGLGKVFNVHGAELYKRCLWCDVKGMHASSYIRRDKRNFPSKLKELLPPPKPRTYAELKDNHVTMRRTSKNW